MLITTKMANSRTAMAPSSRRVVVSKEKTNGTASAVGPNPTTMSSPNRRSLMGGTEQKL
ncbi:hypothetical protein I79_009964 [Cricetulus griseus]|uniref:Uncharacterized protein n=1 Tax=Cricetulus griseus TaxID=10029 RepID=G3HH68_CRIGR|nr:hypothetical protein I79_009964 [Cricetulus griseus]